MPQIVRRGTTSPVEIPTRNRSDASCQRVHEAELRRISPPLRIRSVAELQIVLVEIGAADHCGTILVTYPRVLVTAQQWPLAPRYMPVLICRFYCSRFPKASSFPDIRRT